jgi:hypothetical protein
MVSVSDFEYHLTPEQLYDYSRSHYNHKIARPKVPFRSPVAYVNLVNGELATLDDIEIWAACKSRYPRIRLFYRGPRKYRRPNQRIHNPMSNTLKKDAWGAAIYAV